MRPGALPRSHYHPIRGLLARIEDEGTMRVPPLASGFNPLDTVLDGGFHPHDLILVAGKPAVGKTVCTLQWARHIADQGGHVAYVSYEHSEASLLGRLLHMELCEFSGLLDQTTSEMVRRGIRAWAAGRMTVERLLRIDPSMEAVYEKLLGYASRLFLVRGLAQETDIAELGSIARHVVGPGGMLIIDYVQKVPTESGPALGRAPEVAAGLKEIAMTDHVAVLAVAAVDTIALGQRRVRPQHLASGAPLVHESDVTLVLNEKAPALSKVHTAYDGRAIEEARHWTVFSVEKHRDGPSGLDLEFRKEFEGFRFDPLGGFVGEHLVDDGVYES